MTPAEFVASARSYAGVKFRHRGRSRLGVDCAGLAWCAAKDAGLVLPDFRLYGREPHAGKLIATLEEAIGPAVLVAPVARTDLRIGDVLVVRYRVEPHHIGIATDYRLGGLGVIHSDGHNGKVVEHRLADDMIQRITHVFRFEEQR